MKNKVIQSDLLLLLVATIWGITFVVQKEANQYIGPFGFTFARFLLGGLILIPFAMRVSPLKKFVPKGSSKLKFLLPAMCLGPILIAAASLQQIGLLYTSEANSGFITTFYVILTPIFVYFLGEKIRGNIWVASILMLIGLYFLSIDKGDISINNGDFLTLICALFWTFHVILLSYIVKKIPFLWIAIVQNLICALISLVFALLFEDLTLHNIWISMPYILWAGVISVAVAYTIQVYAQGIAPTTHVAIILSLEAVIAAIAGMIYHQEWMSARAVFGAFLMLVAVLIAELWPSFRDGVLKKIL